MLEDDTHKILAQREIEAKEKDTTLRFYTKREKPFTAYLYKSDNIFVEAPDDPFAGSNDESEGEIFSLDDEE